MLIFRPDFCSLRFTLRKVEKTSPRVDVIFNLSECLKVGALTVGKSVRQRTSEAHVQREVTLTLKYFKWRVGLSVG